MEKATELKVQNTEGGVIFSVKVIPGGRKDCICGTYDGMVKIRIAAPAEKGKANKSLIDFLAQTAGVRKNCLRIISGQTNPVKRIQISGITAEQLINRLKEYN